MLNIIRSQTWKVFEPCYDNIIKTDFLSYNSNYWVLEVLI